jgi:hypothetical protein
MNSKYLLDQLSPDLTISKIILIKHEFQVLVRLTIPGLNVADDVQTILRTFIL